eukprot:TRINITY_DN4718_c0_g1_i2.p1 TRINITY_DN4718_c0_g1~~TRINITY_DN4718_c0_g1_i2.p1  ORF type:complete len:296 (+),score=91.71 TRINITY_DN4718_c0_g1_i2:139-1026(+)
MTVKIAIVGSSGNVGSATIKALSSEEFQTTTVVKAGVRDTSKDNAKALQTGSNIHLVEADMSNKEIMVAAFAGMDAVFVVSPGAEERVKLTNNGVQAAKDAGAKFIMVVSVPTVGTDTVFGRHMDAIETYVKGCGVSYTLLRLPYFMDNFFGNRDPIKEKGHIYTPAKDEAEFTPIAVEDVGLAAATILANYEKHQNKTYTITSGSMTHRRAAAAFSDVLGKPVEHVQVSYDAAKESFMDMGLPEWQADGVVELFQHFNQASPLTNKPTSDFKDITGKEPMPVEVWVQKNKTAFE